MLRLSAVLAVCLALTPVAASVAACGSSASGVDACKSIEEARCNQVPNCPNVEVSPPIWFTSGTAVEACVRYYDTACLHGLSIGSTPSAADLNACVAAINNNGCDVVASPETDPSCAWLVPPAEEDAGDGGDAADGDADADTGVDADEGG
jgi:hypothetical protein